MWAQADRAEQDRIRQQLFMSLYTALVTGEGVDELPDLFRAVGDEDRDGTGR